MSQNVFHDSLFDGSRAIALLLCSCCGIILFKTMNSCFRRRSSCALLVAVFSTACFLHNPASAEAYCSRTAQRSKFWASRQQAFTSNVPSKEAFSDYDVKQRIVAVTQLRAGASTEATTETFWNKQLARELFAEMIGTAMIVGLGTGAVMSAIFTGSLVGLFQIASAWIIAVTLAIATTGSISGAHLNPAISATIALLRPSKSFGWSKVLPYCVAQLVGAVFGSLTNLFLYASKIQEFEKVNAIARGTAESIASAKAFGQYFE